MHYQRAGISTVTWSATSSSRLCKHADDEIGYAFILRLPSPSPFPSPQSSSSSLIISYLSKPLVLSPCIRLSVSPACVSGSHVGWERTVRDPLVLADLLWATAGVVDTALISNWSQRGLYTYRVLCRHGLISTEVFEGIGIY
jgi:hypothetical protein